MKYQNILDVGDLATNHYWTKEGELFSQSSSLKKNKIGFLGGETLNFLRDSGTIAMYSKLFKIS